jgi:hypothetical protein
VQLDRTFTKIPETEKFLRFTACELGRRTISSSMEE